MTSTLLRHLWGWRAYVILVLTPLVLLPLPIILDNSESRCAYVVILMAVYWVTESLPVGVTALIPVFLFPVLGVVGTKAISATYFNDVNMLFLGGLMMAVAIEYWNLHRRIAIGILMLVGSEPRWIMLGMMGATWFLSMWISNTATTAMMVPITEAILVQLRGTKRADGGKSSKRDNSSALGDQDKENGQVTNQQELQLYTIELGEKNGDVVEPKSTNSPMGNDADGDADEEEDVEEDDPGFSRMCKGMSLCICYAANSGGIASLTGTGPNLVMKAEADRIYGLVGLSNPVTFGSWMGLGLPLSAIILVVCWVWLQVAYLRCRGLFSCCSKKEEEEEEKSHGVKAVIRAEYNKLGPVVFGEGLVIVLFILLVLLWITRDMGGVAGWGNLFDSEIKDAVPAIFIAILLFAIPSTVPCIKSYSDPAHPQRRQQGKKLGKDEEAEKEGPVVIRPLLNWEVVNRKMPWHLFLLLGGGFALSKGCLESGLSAWVGEQLEFFSSWNQWAMLLVICYITAAATEVTSNTAISQLLMPIMSRLAIITNRHPLFYMFPVTLACSFAFMLPVATPPNAIVFAYGRIKITDMVAAGSVMNILAVPILVLISGTIGDAIFDFDNVPAEFNSTRSLIASE